MIVSKDRLDRCALEGSEKERMFMERATASGKDCWAGTQQDDWYKHIDVWVNGHGVDVKANRHLECIWLEETNTRGNRGWLRGEATYIAFHIEETDLFHVFYRAELLDWVLTNVTEETTDKREFLKYYTRAKWGKKDRVTKARLSDLEHLTVTTL